MEKSSHLVLFRFNVTDCISSVAAASSSFSSSSVSHVVVFSPFCPAQWEIERGNWPQDFIVAVFQWVIDHTDGLKLWKHNFQNLSLALSFFQESGWKLGAQHTGEEGVFVLLTRGRQADNLQIPPPNFENIGGACQSHSYFTPGVQASKNMS